MNGSETGNKSLMSIVGSWFRSGVVEISSASKIGHIRLMLNGLKNDKNKVAQQMGLKVYSLLEKGELKIPEIDNLFQELRQIDKVITVREAEIEQINREKEIRLLEASGEVTGPSWVREQAKAKQPVSPQKAPAKKVKKALTKKRAATSQTTGKATTKAKKVGAKSKKTGTIAKGSKTTAVKTAAKRRSTAAKRRSTAGKKPTKRPAAKGSKPAKGKTVKPKKAEGTKV